MLSLHPLKTLNACGDGGVLVTDDDTILERILRLRNHGLRIEMSAPSGVITLALIQFRPQF